MPLGDTARQPGKQQLPRFVGGNAGPQLRDATAYASSPHVDSGALAAVSRLTLARAASYRRPAACVRPAGWPMKSQSTLARLPHMVVGPVLRKRTIARGGSRATDGKLRRERQKSPQVGHRSLETCGRRQQAAVCRDFPRRLACSRRRTDPASLARHSVLPCRGDDVYDR